MGGREVTVVVDSSGTHNFRAYRLADELNLQRSDTAPSDMDDKWDDQEINSLMGLKEISHRMINDRDSGEAKKGEDTVDRLNRMSCSDWDDQQRQQLLRLKELLCGIADGAKDVETEPPQSVEQGIAKDTWPKESLEVEPINSSNEDVLLIVVENDQAVGEATQRFDQPYDALVKVGGLRKPDDVLSEKAVEEKAASVWKRKIALVLSNQEKGYIFKVKKEGLKSISLAWAKSYLVVVSVLCHMVSTLPDTGVRKTARRALLDEVVNASQYSNSREEQLLASLVLETFINEPGVLEERGLRTRSINKALRKLRGRSWVVQDIMNLPSVDVTELWSYTEVGALDSRSNGEGSYLVHLNGWVLGSYLVHLNGWVLSSHLDGIIKVWYVGDCIQEVELSTEDHKHLICWRKEIAMETKY